MSNNFFIVPFEKCFNLNEELFNNNKYNQVSITTTEYSNFNETENVVVDKNTSRRTLFYDETTQKYNLASTGSMTYGQQTDTFWWYNKTTPMVNVIYYRYYYGEIDVISSQIDFTLNALVSYSLKQTSLSPAQNLNIITDTKTLSNWKHWRNSAWEQVTDDKWYELKEVSDITLKEQNFDIFANGYDAFIRSNEQTARYMPEYFLHIAYHYDNINKKLQYYILLVDMAINTSFSQNVYILSYDFSMVLNNVMHQKDDGVYGTGDFNGINTIQLPSNNGVCNLSTNGNQVIGLYLVSKTYHAYQNGKKTIQFELPMQDLYDDNNNTAVEVSVLASTPYIFVNDKFIITKNGEPFDNLIYSVTTIENKFNGSYRWVIKAKEYGTIPSD